VVYSSAHEQVLPARCAGLSRKVLLGERFYSMVTGHLQGDDAMAVPRPAWLSDTLLIAQAVPELRGYTTRRMNHR
jgi:hypothetical protein